MICGKCKIILVSKISIWPYRKDKNKKRTRSSLFQSSEDGKQDKFFIWPKGIETPRRFPYVRTTSINALQNDGLWLPLQYAQGWFLVKPDNRADPDILSLDFPVETYLVLSRASIFILRTLS